MASVENILKILADRNRLRILKLLEMRPMCVCELASIIGIKQPSVSRHLKKLMDVGLIGAEQDSYFTLYHCCCCSGAADKIKQVVLQNMNSDPQVVSDRKKAKKINRKMICK